MLWPTRKCLAAQRSGTVGQGKPAVAMVPQRGGEGADGPR